MPERLTVHALERDTYSIQISFYDVDGVTPVTPSSLAFTLTDASGNVMNSRSNVSITPGTSVWIELTDADLTIGSYGVERRVLVTGSYNSGTHGSGRKINREYIFTIDNAVNVS